MRAFFAAAMERRGTLVLSRATITRTVARAVRTAQAAAVGALRAFSQVSRPVPGAAAVA